MWLASDFRTELTTHSSTLNVLNETWTHISFKIVLNVAKNPNRHLS